MAFAEELAAVELHFDANMTPYGARVEKIKAHSTDALSLLGVKGRRFDFVYLDGSHRAADVYADACVAWSIVGLAGSRYSTITPGSTCPMRWIGQKSGSTRFCWRQQVRSVCSIMASGADRKDGRLNRLTALATGRPARAAAIRCAARQATREASETANSIPVLFLRGC